jgi:hypothetical protein
MYFQCFIVSAHSSVFRMRVSILHRRYFLRLILGSFHAWIVDIVVTPVYEEAIGVRHVERSIPRKALWLIGVGDKHLVKGFGVGFAVLDGLFG